MLMYAYTSINGEGVNSLLFWMPWFPPDTDALPVQFRPALPPSAVFPCAIVCEGLIQSAASCATFPALSFIHHGQKCIIGKNVQNFFVIRIFVVGHTFAPSHNCWHIPKKQERRFKNWVTYPANIFQISRSAPPLLHTSTRNDVFLITLYAATYWKNGIHDNAGNGIVLLANAISGIGCNKKWKKNPSNEGEKRKYNWTTGTKKPDW